MMVDEPRRRENEGLWSAWLGVYLGAAADKIRSFPEPPAAAFQMFQSDAAPGPFR